MEILESAWLYLEPTTEDIYLHYNFYCTYTVQKILQQSQIHLKRQCTGPVILQQLQLIRYTVLVYCASGLLKLFVGKT